MASRFEKFSERARRVLSDRKSVVQGKSVDLGGRRMIKKKKKKSHMAVGSVTTR